MAWQGMSSRSPVEPAAVVEAPTLKEALRLVRSRYGEDARVVRSRSVTRRQPGGLGQQRTVEVLVRADEAPGARRPAVRAAEGERAAPAHLAREISAEVDRLEELVRKIVQRQTGVSGHRRCRDNAAAEALVAAGADAGVVVRWCERCQAETGAGPRDHDALLKYLGRSLPTVRGGLEGLAGLHVFLGPPGAGRSELVLRLAAKLGQLQRQVLVLSLLPRHNGEVRRLQAAAADAGFDAAVLQNTRQLAAAAAHLQAYDVVLLDAPSFATGENPQDAELQRALGRQASCHRHLVFPLDRDLRDSLSVIEAARHWHCDWLALSRIDQTQRRGKLLDLLERLPLPISICGDATWPLGEPRSASGDLLIDLMLGAARRLAVGGD